MKRTLCKKCNPKKETIIGVEKHCSECGIEMIHILNETSEYRFAQMREADLRIED